MKSFVIRFQIIVVCSTIEKVTKSLARTLIHINCHLIVNLEAKAGVFGGPELNE